MVTILERANSHPLTYTRLLEPEYRQRGILQSPYHPWVLKKHLREIQEVDYIAVTSDFTKLSLLEHGIDVSRILLTPLGVDSDRFVPRFAEDTGENLADDDTFRVLYIGQICLRKGIPYLLEAWNTLQFQRAELLLVGYVVEDIKEILHSYLHQNPTITVLPNTSDPVEFYQQASVNILPTLEDGFGLVVLEAMACGIPVIVTKHAGVKDCVRPETDGFIIPPASVDAIADTLRYCYMHRTHLKAMGYCARQQAEHFSWTCYQDGIAAHLKEIEHG
jgi:glycosyltransferase involved in cell wall biosynthesis